MDQVEKKEADIKKAVDYNYTDKDIELVSLFFKKLRVFWEQLF